MRPYSLVFLIFQIFGAHSFIIPDEIPTLLSVIYSNIPVIKKGTDSRIGWGFRLGNRADFQVLVELGPQTYTQPLANQEDKNTNKRNTLNSLSDTLWAQRQRDKQNKQKIKQVADAESGNWLETWSKSVKESNKPVEQELPTGAKPGIAIGEIDAKSVIPDDSVLNLSKLSQEGSVNKKEVQSDIISDDSVVKLTELYNIETTKNESESVIESTTVQGTE